MIQLLKLDQTPIWVKYEYRTYLSIFVSKNAWSECKAWKQNPFWSEKPISSILYSVASDCLKPFLSWNTPFLFSSSKSLSHYRYIIPVFSIISECATFFTSNLWCSIGSLPHFASICMGIMTSLLGTLPACENEGAGNILSSWRTSPFWNPQKRLKNTAPY